MRTVDMWTRNTSLVDALDKRKLAMRVIIYWRSHEKKVSGHKSFLAICQERAQSAGYNRFLTIG